MLTIFRTHILQIFVIQAVFFIMHFNVNNVTSIFINDLYMSYLFVRDNRFLFCNYKVTDGGGGGGGGLNKHTSSKKK